MIRNARQLHRLDRISRLGSTVLVGAVIWSLAFFATATPVLAVQVGPGAFTSQAIIEHYEGLGLPFDSFTPIVIGGDTYRTDDNDLRYHSDFGAFIGRTGYAVGNNTELGYIDITLGSPALRAGLYVGVDAAWSADVSFFNVANNVLGTISAAGLGSIGQFAGWQADAGLIKRIRITDTQSNNRIIIVDDFIREAVPEPSALSLLVFGMSAFSARRRFRRNAMCAKDK